MTDVVKDEEALYEFDPSISEEEREFYLKAYPSPDYVRDRKSHCTTCKVHIGTAPCNEHGIKMHPILRVTHCARCHAFYNSGEFSKGEDGSELYCRWCGQGGEVYCCSNCPFVFCKSCITKNLSRGVVADIEQNENWRCFACAPKILWPLRALHWALINYIEKQKKEIEDMNLSEQEQKIELSKDRSTCCRLAKAKCGNMSDSLESVDSLTSKRSSSSQKKKQTTPASQTPPTKRMKTSNDEVVCTPDLLSMLEPDCQITVPAKQPSRTMQPVTTPKIFTVQQNYVQPQRSSVPPPLVLRNTGVQLRPVATQPVLRRTVVSPRTPAPVGSNSPVYHTINGYRIDLNSAAQQGTYRLPNGKLIQVKRQSAATATPNNVTPTSVNNWPQSQASQRTGIQATPVARSVQITPQRSFVTMQSTSGGMPQGIRYPSSMIGNTVIAPFNHNGPQIQMINGGGGGGGGAAAAAVATPAVQQAAGTVPVRPVIMRHTFPDNPIGQARTKLQDEIFSAMEICQHLTGKLQTLTNSNAYKQARNLMEVKELYIHLSYLLTYAIGRYKGLQDKCLGDMRQLGFSNDADSLENGQIAAGVDYVRYGQLEDVELFTSGSNSFHNQIYEYRKSLLANLDDSLKMPLSPLYPLTSLIDEYDDTTGLEDSRDHDDQWQEQNNSKIQTIDDDDDDDVQEVPLSNEPTGGQYMDTYPEEDTQEDIENADEDFYSSMNSNSMQRGTEDVMRREEESHAYDRKLTRLIEQYPSIWCTRHPDYGNFEVTRKQWRTIASHFKRSEDIKMRWKNIRKRYVRIERRMHEGKRFNGYFDKATNFLINRDTPMSDWVAVDCGTDDGDVYERKKLDALEKELYKTSDPEKKFNNDFGEPLCMTESCAPIEIRPLDIKIIHFVKCNPVLWRKSSDPTFHKMDEQTRKSLWMHLWKSVPNIRCSDLIDRWTQLYEMYKTFRLKTIKSASAMAALEIKYSKYLAKLYFLYKIDEEELQSEYNGLVYGDDLKDDEEETDKDVKLLDLPDDREFVQELMRVVREYPQIWNPNHVDYHDVQLRDETWKEIGRALEQYKHKQASDDEDNEIEIVEPKTDTINLDSDNEDQDTVSSTGNTSVSAKVTATPSRTAPSKGSSSDSISTAEGSPDFMDATHNILASMLEIDIVEGNDAIVSSGGAAAKKQPRKKTTSKPNPTLLKQKQLIERQKLDDMKKNDAKLKLNCIILVRRAEKEFPYTVGILKQRYEKRREIAKRLAAEKALQEKENAEKMKSTENVANKGESCKNTTDKDKVPVILEVHSENESQKESNQSISKGASDEKDANVKQEETHNAEIKSDSKQDNSTIDASVDGEGEKAVQDIVDSEKKIEEKQAVVMPEVKQDNTSTDKKLEGEHIASLTETVDDTNVNSLHKSHENESRKELQLQVENVVDVSSVDNVVKTVNSNTPFQLQTSPADSEIPRAEKDNDEVDDTAKNEKSAILEKDNGILEKNTTKMSTDQELIFTNEAKNVFEITECVSSQSSSSLTLAANEKHLSFETSLCKQEVFHPEGFQQASVEIDDNKAQIQSMDVDMITENQENQNNDTEKAKVSTTQSTESDNEDHEIESKSPIDNEQNPKQNSFTQEDLLENTKLGTSDDAISKSLNVTGAIADAPENDARDGNTQTIEMSEAMSVVTESNN